MCKVRPINEKDLESSRHHHQPGPPEQPHQQPIFEASASPLLS